MFQIRGCNGTYGCDANPPGEQEPCVLETTGDGEQHGRRVRIDRVDRDEPDDSRLRGVVDEPAEVVSVYRSCLKCSSSNSPSRHQTVREEERQVPRREAPDDSERRLGRRERGAQRPASSRLSVALAPGVVEEQLEQTQSETEDGGRAPPDGGQDGGEAEGEEPGVPAGRDVEDDGDAGLEEGGVDGRGEVVVGGGGGGGVLCPARSGGSRGEAGGLRRGVGGENARCRGRGDGGGAVVVRARHGRDPERRVARGRVLGA